MTEQWKDIPGFEGRYQVSNLGQVKSLPNSRFKTERIMKLKPAKRGGYWTVGLTFELDGRWKQKTMMVHLLALEAFVGPRPSPAHEGCHEDGNPRNARIDNLRWDTTSSNQMDRVKHGTSNRGESNGSCLLNEADVREIKRRLGDGEKIVTIAEDFGVSRNTISAIKTGRNWSWI